jgi:hypothetical protein
MHVAVLQQFLRSLVPPLRAAGSGEGVAGQLENACQSLEPFRDRPLAEFGQFLVRCHEYERQGHWPSRSPAIAGELFDEPTPAQYAERLRALVQKEVTGTSLSERAHAELKKLERSLQLPVLKLIAEQLGVTAPASRKPQVINQLVAQLTGQPLASKRTSRGTAGVDDSALQSLAERLRQRAGTPELDAELARIKNQSMPALKELARLLGVKGAQKRKGAALTAIREQLSPASSGSVPSVPASSQVERFAEIIRALKAKAEVPGAPEEEIEAELRSLEQQMDRETALAVCAHLGTGRTAKSQHEAFDAIRRKVFEVKRARESIAY